MRNHVQSRRKYGFHPKYNLARSELISQGNPHRIYPQIPLKKQNNDDDDDGENRIRTSSVSSTSAPLIDHEQPLSVNNAQENVKVNPKTEKKTLNFRVNRLTYHRY